MTSKRAKKPETNARLLTELRGILQRDFGGEDTHGAKAALAKRLGMSHVHLGELLKGHRGFGDSVVEAMAEYLHKSPDELLGRTRVSPDTEGMDPEKAAAIQFATGLYDDRAIAEVLGQDLGGGRGRSRKFWLAMIEARHDELQKDATDPSRVARRLADSAAETARVLAEDNAAKARAAKMVETEKAKRPKKP